MPKRLDSTQPITRRRVSDANRGI